MKRRRSAARSSKTVRTELRVTAESRARWLEAAQTSGRSLGNWIKWVCETAIERTGKRRSRQA